MRYLSLREIFELHDKIIEISGGARGIRDMPALESAINQPRLTFNRSDLFNKSGSTLFLSGYEPDGP